MVINSSPETPWISKVKLANNYSVKILRSINMDSINNNSGVKYHIYIGSRFLLIAQYYPK